MSIDSPDDLAGLRRVGNVVRETLDILTSTLRPGVTTRELDCMAKEVFRRHGARSAPQVEYGFPGTVLISVNDEAVHGIPSGRVIQPSDLVKLDVTPELDGYVADAAVTVAMPLAPVQARQLARCAESALQKAISSIRVGRPVNEIGRVVEREVARRAFCVLRELGGHGVGRRIHEPPNVLNYYQEGLGHPLTEGLVFTVEPIIAATARRVYTDSDGWTVKTVDASLAAHFEHTIVVLAGRPEVITA
jgi:methionyl aminopeptidase